MGMLCDSPRKDSVVECTQWQSLRLFVFILIVKSVDSKEIQAYSTLPFKMKLKVSMFKNYSPSTWRQQEQRRTPENQITRPRCTNYPAIKPSLFFTILTLLDPSANIFVPMRNA